MSTNATKLYCEPVEAPPGEAPLPPKVCRGCGEAKPRVEFHPDASKWDGLSRLCKPCHRAVCRKNNERRSPPRPPKPVAPPGMKWCGPCGAAKPIGEFYARADSRDGLAHECKACAKAREAAWIKENRERAKASRAAWYANNKERHRAKRLEWCEANPGRKAAINRAWAERNAARKAAMDRAWVLANRARVREIKRLAFGKRRAAGCGTRMPKGVLAELGKAQRWRCAVCRCDIRSKYQLDHIQPIARGGRHERRNFQLLCGPCNLQKRAKDPILFMQECGRLL